MNSPVPNLFDPANARELCALSAEAYLTPAATEASIFWKEEADTHVRLEQRGSDLLVSFRGTADLRNWLTDLEFELIRVGDFRVHRGFHEAVQAVEFDLAACLGRAGETRLWVTGHSLGGALAKLWALSAAECGHDVAGVYTFGQPRVGDTAFAARYDEMLKAQTFRVIHADDIVPRVPWQLGRYRHAGHEVYFPRPFITVGRDSPQSGPLSCCSVSVEPNTIKSGFDGVSPYRVDLPWPVKLVHDLPAFARSLGRGKLGLVADHHIRRYLALFPATQTEACLTHS